MEVLGEIKKKLVSEANPSVKRLELYFSGTSAVYRAGEVVSCVAVLEISQSLQIAEIAMYFKGKAKVNWTTVDGHRRHKYASDEKYYSFKEVVYEPLKGMTHHPTGTHHYQTSFTLPSLSPPSFTGKHGCIQHSVTCKITCPGAVINPMCKALFTVARHLDIMVQPKLLKPKEVQGQKKFHALPFSTGVISASMIAHRISYAPKHKLQVEGQCTNNSSATFVDYSVHLRQCVQYAGKPVGIRSDRPIWNYENRDIAEISRGYIAPGSTVTFSGRDVIIPAVQASGLPGCSILEMKYIVYVKVDPGIISRNLRLELPIVIGSAPPKRAKPANRTREGAAQSRVPHGTELQTRSRLVLHRRAPPPIPPHETSPSLNPTPLKHSSACPATLSLPPHKIKPAPVPAPRTHLPSSPTLSSPTTPIPAPRSRPRPAPRITSLPE